MQSRFVCLLVAFTLSTSVSYSSRAAALPAELSVNGQPLPNACINHLVNALSPDGETITLSDCAALTGTEQEQLNVSYLGRMRGGFVLHTTWSREGAGNFSDISIIRRKGDKLSLHREVAAGDRCNGGITEAWIERGKLFYKINLTPYDMVAYADTSTTLKAYDDLESSASSCFAIGTFLHTQESQPVLQLVSLNQNDLDTLLSDANWPRNYRHQTCFNKLFLDSINAGENTLDTQALGSWVQRFYAACVAQTGVESQPLTPIASEPVPKPLSQPTNDTAPLHQQTATESEAEDLENGTD